jgi:transcriptional regulator with GAF, ATPase, and Fis domain
VLQTKLLRVLQEKSVMPVGASAAVPVGTRLIAATHRDILGDMRACTFREDLFYRLSVVVLHVAPLRERKEDIPLLAKHFVDLSAKELRCARPRLTPAGLVKLQGYDWPGNVRELRNVIERAVILARGGALDFDLPIQALASPPADARYESIHEPEFLTEAELQLRERENLLRILGKTNWKIKGPDGAAELLGVKPTTLLSRIEKWGIRKPGAARD